MTERIDAAGGASPATPAIAADSGGATLSTARMFPPGRREIRIDHDGKEYRLRITKQNKLILTR